jgi:hypothetical protein
MRPERRATVDLPAPTAWPMIAAFGITLAWAGLVTNALVTIVGVIATLWGAVGWFRDVLPVQHLEAVDVEPDPVVARSTRQIAYVQAGEGPHRARLPVAIYPYSAGIVGGIAGGVAMAVLASLYGVIFHGSVWYPINLLAAGTMASLATATPEELVRFHAPAVAVATVIHAVMSLLVGLLYAVLLPMLPRRPILFGGVVVPLLWTGLIWASLRVVNPILNARIDWPWFVASQLAFGIVTGLVVSRREKIATRQHAPLAIRAGIEFAEEGRER